MTVTHLDKIKRITLFILGGLILIALLVVFPFVKDMVYNEIRLVSLRERTKIYGHPDSQLVQTFSLIGNFAPASNQCGFIVAQLRTTSLKPNDIRTFYAPILTIPSYGKDPPYHEVNVYILTDEKDSEDLQRLYPDVNEQITQKAIQDTHAYLLITAETGYQPNYDLRCH